VGDAVAIVLPGGTRTGSESENARKRALKEAGEKPRTHHRIITGDAVEFNL
jgi:hypothetical protein